VTSSADSCVDFPTAIRRTVAEKANGPAAYDRPQYWALMSFLRNLLQEAAKLYIAGLPCGGHAEPSTSVSAPVVAQAYNIPRRPPAAEPQLRGDRVGGYLDAFHMRLPRGRSEANTAWLPMSHGPRRAIQGAGLDRPSTDNAPYGLAGRPAIVHAVRPSW
jgi:hypothetical protein